MRHAQRLISPSSTGYGIWEDRGHSVQEDKWGSFILAGFTGSDDMVNPDVFLYRADTDGSGLWNATIYESNAGGAPTLDERGFSVQAMPIGYTVAGDAGEGTDKAGYVVSTLPSGTPQWVHVVRA